MECDMRSVMRHIESFIAWYHERHIVIEHNVRFICVWNGLFYIQIIIRNIRHRVWLSGFPLQVSFAAHRSTNVNHAESKDCNKKRHMRTARHAIKMCRNWWQYSGTGRIIKWGFVFIYCCVRLHHDIITRNYMPQFIASSSMCDVCGNVPSFASECGKNDFVRRINDTM